MLENGKLLGSGVFNAGTMENIAGVEFKVDKTKRFKNVDYIIQVSVSGEACGIPTYEQTYFMKRKGFSSLTIATISIRCRRVLSYRKI